METQTSVEIYSIPKALSPASNVSSLIIEQSREFTARLSVRKIVVSNGSIEIHLIKQATLIPVCCSKEEASDHRILLERCGDHYITDCCCGRRY